MDDLLCDGQRQLLKVLLAVLQKPVPGLHRLLQKGCDLPLLLLGHLLPLDLGLLPALGHALGKARLIALCMGLLFQLLHLRLKLGHSLLPQLLGLLPGVGDYGLRLDLGKVDGPRFLLCRRRGFLLRLLGPLIRHSALLIPEILQGGRRVPGFCGNVKVFRVRENVFIRVHTGETLEYARHTEDLLYASTMCLYLCETYQNVTGQAMISSLPPLRMMISFLASRSRIMPTMRC